MSFTASDVLLKAASRIEEEGMWCQGRMYQDDAACALGMLLRVAFDLDASTDATNSAVELVDDLVSGLTDGDSLVKWNDAPGRTAHEVAEAMRKAAL